MDRRSLTLAAALSGALGLAAAPAVAQAPRTLTFKEADKGGTFKFVDNPPRGRRPSVGDVLVFTEPLVSASGARRGTLRATCTITGASVKAVPAVCYGVFSLKEGQLAAVVSTANLDGKTTDGVIVGGTRAYAGARGTFHSTDTKSGSNDTVTLTG
jgi:hypothetical protein